MSRDSRKKDEFHRLCTPHVSAKTMNVINLLKITHFKVAWFEVTSKKVWKYTKVHGSARDYLRDYVKYALSVDPPVNFQTWA